METRHEIALNIISNRLTICKDSIHYRMSNKWLNDKLAEIEVCRKFLELSLKGDNEELEKYYWNEVSKYKRES